MRALRTIALAGLLGAAFTAQAAPVTYTVDAGHTMVLFSWNHFGFSNPTANLTVSDGTIVFDEQDPTKSSVEVTMPLSGLDTHVSKLDEHLKKADFFDADTYPTITFKSSKVDVVGLDSYQVTGDLTVHGVSKPVVLQVKLNKAGENPFTKAPEIGFEATGTLKRSDFGVGAYAPQVSDEIQIRITSEATGPKVETKPAAKAKK